MYTEFYKLKERPFEITPDPKFEYPSEIHQEALAHLKYAVREGKGFTVITGEAGTGKTTLVHLLLSQLDGQIRTAYIFNPILDRSDFLNYVCHDLGIESNGEKWSRGQNLMVLHKFLIDCFSRGEKVFLIIDEAQSMQPELLHEVRLLTNLETSKNKLLHVILLGQPELDRTLETPKFLPLKQRITVRYHIHALSLQETKEYILHRLKRAGARNLSLFDKAAIKAIYNYSKGIPRLINIVCDNAMLMGFSLDQPNIGKSIIRDVIRNLEIAKKSHGWWTLSIILTIVLVLCGFAFQEWLVKFGLLFQESIYKLWG